MSSKAGERTSIHKGTASPLRSALLLVHLVGNCGLVLYSHIGLSFELFTNVPPPNAGGSADGSADGSGGGASDGGGGGDAGRRVTPEHSATCGGRRLTAAGCNSSDVALLADRQQAGDMFTATAEECGLELLGSASCAEVNLLEQALISPSCCVCGAELLHCSTACLTQCVDDPFADECFDCQRRRGCIAPFDSCSGMTYATDVLGRDASPADPPSDAETTYYSIGEPGRISFTNSVVKLWESGAPGLALLIAVASGVNPYLECVLLAVAWFVPMPSSQRGRLLWWVNRVGRWSFLDIFVVVFLCTGLHIQLAGGTIQLAVETKACIYAFGIATVWARIIGTYVESGHRRCAQAGGADSRIACRCVGALSRKRLDVLLLASSAILLVLTVCGMALPFIGFGVELESAGVTEEKVYSAVTLGSAAGEADLAGAVSMLLLVVPYLLWGVLLPVAVSSCLLLALALGLVGHHSGRKLIVGVCDMVGSAASLDVLVLAAGISTMHFGELVTESIRCIDENVADDWIVNSQVASGFFLMCMAAPAQWVMQEVCLALRDGESDAVDAK